MAASAASRNRKSRIAFGIGIAAADRPRTPVPARCIGGDHRAAGDTAEIRAAASATAGCSPNFSAQAPQGYLAAHSVEKSFGARKVVSGASLFVRRGEAVGLLGPNGAGKTTIFYMITGLIKADNGKIELDGNDVTPLPMYQRARLGIGYLPQEASIFRGLNVEDNIRSVLEVVEPDPQDARARSRRAARRVQHRAAAQVALDRAVRRRAAALRNRARARQPARATCC